MNQYELVQRFQVYWAVGKGGDIVLGEQVRGRHGTAEEGKQGGGIPLLPEVKGWGDALPRRAAAPG